MANSNSHPFNADAVAMDSIVQSTDQHEHKMKNHRPHKDLIDLLLWNYESDGSLTSNDTSFSVALHSVSDEDFNRLKYLIRSLLWPINHPIRRQLWMNISTLTRINTSKTPHEHQSSQTALTTLSTMMNNHFNTFSLKSNPWPKFVDTNNLCFYHLTESTGHSLLQRVLFSFAVHHPDVTFCPTLEPFSALLLHYHHENEVLYILNRLLIKNWLCGGTYLQWEAHCHVFEKLLRSFNKSAADIIDLCYPNTKVFYQGWFWWIFRYLPYSYLVKIMDCMLFEGPKVLFRISLILVYLFSKKIKQEPNGSIQNINEFCQQIPLSVDRLLYKAFHIRNFKRRTIDQLIDDEEKLLRSTRHQSSSENKTTTDHDQQLSFVIPPEKSILNQEQFVTLWNWLPARLSLSQPALVFTTEEHGFRLQTLLNKIDELEHSILIVKATNGEIFGAFCAGLWADRHNRTYFGFGESFLFTLTPKQTKYSWVGRLENGEKRQNQAIREMFLFVNHEKLIIGGGNGDGLCIDQSLCDGRTGHCETFNNEPLCSQPYFSISVLEMIAFDSSSS